MGGRKSSKQVRACLWARLRQTEGVQAGRLPGALPLVNPAPRDDWGKEQRGPTA